MVIMKLGEKVKVKKMGIYFSSNAFSTFIDTNYTNQKIIHYLQYFTFFVLFFVRYKGIAIAYDAFYKPSNICESILYPIPCTFFRDIFQWNPKYRFSIGAQRRIFFQSI